MNFWNRKDLMLLTTVLCGVGGLEANVAKAQDLDILEILNASETKSPNISWALGSEGEADTVEILGKYYTYSWTQNDPARKQYTERQNNTLSGDVNADFIGSYYETTDRTNTGSALYNNQTIDNLDADFIANHGQYNWLGGNGIFYVGALVNEGTIKNLSGDFIGNSAEGNGYTLGGTLINFGEIGSINGRFIGNTAKGDRQARGAAIENAGTIENIYADFIDNYVFSSEATAYGGAIKNYTRNGHIKKIVGNFINNQAVAREAHGVWGGAIANGDYSHGIDYIIGNFIGNSIVSLGNSNPTGGAIDSTDDHIGTIIGDFIRNYASSEGGNPHGGAIWANSPIDLISGDFIENHASGFDLTTSGGAIHNAGSTFSFMANASDEMYESDILFQGNYISVNGTKYAEAIYNEGSSAVLNFEAKGSGSYTFYDYINGDNNGTINFTGDGTGVLNLYNDIKGQNEVNFKADYIVNMQDGALHQISANKVNINSALNMLVDVDLAAKKMDRFENAEISENGSILVTGIKILSDGAEELTQIDFADANKDKVDTSVREALSRQYIYKVEYDKATGQFEFIREAKLTSKDLGINQAPAVANTGAMMLTEAVSQKVLNTDSIKVQGASSGDAFGLKAWVQTFGSRDDVELKHMSPTIDAKFYGVLGGIDSKTFAYDNGVKATYGVYGAYTRSEQKYSGNKIKQKGGYFGLKALFEKGGLFSKLSANMGFLNNEALTKWGKDKFDTKVISAATQTGYDFKLKPTKVPFNKAGHKPFYEMNMDVTITPSLYVGYMGIDTDDYTNKLGFDVKNKFMNVVEIAPELKVLNNFGNGLEGYLKGAYKMFIYDNDQVRVDTALLPSMSVKPYVEYGFGFEKSFSSAKAYGDVMRHDGGKRGWDFNLGVKLEF